MAEALLIVDIQNDFLPGGALAVPGSDAIIPVVNTLARRYQNVVLTQDWHPAGHVSFASSHAGQAPFDRLTLGYGEQVLWPDHCVQGTAGADLAEALAVPHAALIIRKGHQPKVDSYSAFLEADRRTPTGLAGYLRERGIDRLACAGLALDYCVAWTAFDAIALGFGMTVIEDACRAMDAGSASTILAQMRARGISIERSTGPHR